MQFYLNDSNEEPDENQCSYPAVKAKGFYV